MSAELEQLKELINKALPLAEEILSKAKKMENTKLTRKCFADMVDELENHKCIVENTAHLNRQLKRDL